MTVTSNCIIYSNLFVNDIFQKHSVTTLWLKAFAGVEETVFLNEVLAAYMVKIINK